MNLAALVFSTIALSVCAAYLSHWWQVRQERRRELDQKFFFCIGAEDLKPVPRKPQRAKAAR